MKFGKRYSNMTVFMAMLHGVLIGVAAVLVIGLVLFMAKGKDNPDTVEKEVTASGPPPVETPAPTGEKPLQLFAKQHGAFSTSESAALFIEEDPSLAKAAVIQVGDKFYIWSAVGLTEGEIEITDTVGTYRKAFSADTLACGAVGAGKLREVLAETDIAKIKSLIEGQSEGAEDKKVDGFQKNITAITAFTQDLQIIRLRLLSHYSYTDSCVKFAF